MRPIRIDQLADAQRSHDLAGFPSDELEVVGHAFWQAVIVIAAQFFILSCHAGRAVVQVADTQVFTAQCDHRAGAEAKALCTQNGSLNNVDAGFQATIHL